MYVGVSGVVFGGCVGRCVCGCVRGVVCRVLGIDVGVLGMVFGGCVGRCQRYTYMAVSSNGSRCRGSNTTGAGFFCCRHLQD